MGRKKIVWFVVGGMIGVLLVSGGLFAQQPMGPMGPGAEAMKAGMPPGMPGAPAGAPGAAGVGPTVLPAGAVAPAAGLPTAPVTPPVQPGITGTGFNFTPWLVIVVALIGGGLILRRYAQTVKGH